MTEKVSGSMRIRRATRGTAPVRLSGRLVVPVLAAHGGTGRSTVAGLLAAALTTPDPPADRPVLLVDTGTVADSPWPGWVSARGTGAGSLAWPLTAGQVWRACSTWDGPAGPLPVLADTGDLTAGPPPQLPVEPNLWRGAGYLSGAAALVADTVIPLLPAAARAGHDRPAGPVVGWLAGRRVVPVLCGTATGTGLAGLLALVTLLEQTGYDTRRMMVAISCPAPGGLPRPLRPARVLLTGRVAAIVTVPYDPAIRVHGLTQPDLLRAASWRAGRQLATTAVGLLAPAPGDQPPADPAIARPSQSPTPAAGRLPVPHP